MATYKLTAVNTTGALQIETDSTRVDFLIPDDISVNYDVTNSVINIGTGAIQFQFTVANTVDSAGNPFANFAALKTFIEGIFFLNSGASYLVYRALLNQSGTDAPTAIVLENTLGEVPTFAYSNPGVYTLNTVGTIFTANKTFILVKNCFFSPANADALKIFTALYSGTQNINLYTSFTANNGGGNAAMFTSGDVDLNNIEIEILIYP